MENAGRTSKSGLAEHGRAWTPTNLRGVRQGDQQHGHVSQPLAPRLHRVDRVRRLRLHRSLQTRITVNQNPISNARVMSNPAHRSKRSVAAASGGARKRAELGTERTITGARRATQTNEQYLRPGEAARRGHVDSAHAEQQRRGHGHERHRVVERRPAPLQDETHGVSCSLPS